MGLENHVASVGVLGSPRDANEARDPIDMQTSMKLHEDLPTYILVPLLFHVPSLSRELRWRVFSVPPTLLSPTNRCCNDGGQPPAQTGQRSLRGHCA